jgi:hypothetical protein
MLTRTNPINRTLEPFDVRAVPYEVVEFAHDELKEMASRLRFSADCLPDGVVAQKQIRINAELLERRATSLLYEHCEHEFEWVTQPGTVHGPVERFHVCKHCGAENQED